jgi:hypothetical protein
MLSVPLKVFQISGPNKIGSETIKMIKFDLLSLVSKILPKPVPGPWNCRYRQHVVQRLKMLEVTSIPFMNDRFPLGFRHMAEMIARNISLANQW